MLSTIKSHTARLLNIYDEDWKPLLTLQGFIVSICAVIASLKTVSNALFVAHVGAKNLPFTYIGCALTLIVSGMILLPVIDKMQRHRVYILTVSILAGFVFFAYGMISCGQDWIYYFLYIVSYIMDTVLFLEFWLIASDLCDARQAKRVFPLIIGWSLVGGMIGAFGTKLLVRYFVTEQLLLISGTALASTIFIIFLIKMIFPKEIAMEEKTRRTSGVSKLERFKMDLNIMRESPLLKYICTSFILYSFLTYLLDFQFNIAASAHFSAEGKVLTEKLTAFYGLFDGVCISAALVFQFFIANRFLNIFGVANSQLVLPAVFAAGFSSIFGNLFFSKTTPPPQPFYSTLLTRLGQKVASSSIYRSSYNLLYNPISKEKRGRSKAFSESLIQPVGVLIVGVSILFMKGVNPFVICGVSVAVSVLYVFNILRLKRAYIKTILSMFDAKNYSQIESFAGLFGKLGEQEILQRLYQVMDDKDFNIRCFIIDILGEIRNKSAADPLAEMYAEEENDKVRASIVRVLGELGGQKAVTVVKRAVDDPHPRIRANAIEAIVCLKSPALYPLIAPRLGDPHHRVKANAAIHILALKLEKYAPAAVQTLVDMFEKGNDEDKVSALYAFGEAADEQSLTYITKGIRSANAQIRHRAILALGQTGFPQAAELLIGIIRTSNNSAVKNIATQSLVSLGKNALNTLVAALKDPNVFEHKYIIKALTPIADKRLYDILEKTAAEEIESIKHNLYYIERLETIAQKDAVVILIDSLGEQITEAKENVMNILAILCGNTKSIKSIIKNLHHPNRFARANAIEALEQVGAKDIVKELIPLIETEHLKRIPPLSVREQEQLTSIKDLLSSHYQWIRAAAVFSLGRLKAVNHKEEIIKLLKDPYDLARANAIEALGQMAGEDAQQLFEEALTDQSQLVRAYAQAALRPS
jgi:HEAT repeat protein